MIQTEKFAQIEVQSAAALRDWLTLHHAQSDSVWLVTWKKAPGAPYVPVSEVLDELVAFGWIDGVRRKLDAHRTMQLISPRKQQAWAATYKQRAARLEAEGRMHPAGLAAIAAAKAAGRWDETAAVDALQVPPDLAEALAASGSADRFFSAAAPSYRRNVLRWLHNAKRAETRAARIAQIVTASAQARKLPQL
ncbi:YdeI/OmpD-associated family protein [Pseudotabrizicola algicola]|uniref:Bacteriocin-protection protein n=1 Tax=Pseudotabrizicola algicola TaxID=2709381 RepID=A0A6B3RNU0_9RHOB|nr:YdeI/OmpD-associated family protein [Pseudotabrizicola algicola]NEX47784.1 hypothetical protein [Pseudotabrizicola algicola]